MAVATIERKDVEFGEGMEFASLLDGRDFRGTNRSRDPEKGWIQDVHAEGQTRMVSGSGGQGREKGRPVKGLERQFAELRARRRRQVYVQKKKDKNGRGVGDSGEGKLERCAREEE
ncbi:hypothetical protein MMC14_003808 [Varicellaria rhodocarpa]|nr:hypothetical protein [Varicellaria rhodocarpa]